MNDLTERYIKLLHNRQQLQQLAAQHSMAHFCDLLARYLDGPDLTVALNWRSNIIYYA